MALELAVLTRDEEMAKMIQLVIEPDPQPPYDSRRKATAQRITDARQRLAEIYAPADR